MYVYIYIYRHKLSVTAGRLPGGRALPLAPGFRGGKWEGERPKRKGQIDTRILMITGRCPRFPLKGFLKGDIDIEKYVDVDVEVGCC